MILVLTPSCYDDWLITERERLHQLCLGVLERLHQLCLGVLERLVASYERQQEPVAALPYAQQLKSLELRIVMSLARLWQQQGQVTEAHQLLAEIYGWFTEGFDTADLVEAKTLLTALAASISTLPIDQTLSRTTGSPLP